MDKQTQLTPNQKKGCLIGCLAPIILIALILIIAASMDAFDRNKIDNAEKKVLDTSLSIEERTTYAVTSVLGEENNKDENRNIAVHIEGEIVYVRLLGDGISSEEHTLISYQNDIVKILGALQPIEDLETISIAIQAKFLDTYGNETTEDALRVIVVREELDKINFENFYGENLPKVADNYYVHPALLK